ncbi:hypothetical protein GCM10023238_08390 [Streptomyces heliomycini]
MQGLVTYLGSVMALIALPLQIKELTAHRSRWARWAPVELVPLVVFGLYGGALADAVDRRKVIVLTEAGLGLLAAVLLLNALLPHPMLWPLYVVAAPRWRHSPDSSAPPWTHCWPGSSHTSSSPPRRAQRPALAGGRDRRTRAGRPSWWRTRATSRLRHHRGLLPRVGPDVPPALTRAPVEHAAKPSLRGIAEEPVRLVAAGAPRHVRGSTWRRCSSPSPTPSSPSSPTSSTPTGHWA